jgi:enoyl-CoA hydratase
VSVDTSDVLYVEIEDRVATVTLNRPASRNALNAELRRLIRSTMTTIDADPDIDVVILTGADPAFCAGIDLKELGAATGGVTSAGGLDISGDSRPFDPMSTPVIGAINGVAITGGFELALLCDFLVASEHARFADTHARVGIQPGWGLTTELPRAVGYRRAKELSATGNFCDAQRALDWGLVNHVVPHTELMAFARKLAADIAGNDRAGVRRILRTYDEGARLTGADAARLEAEVSSEWIRSVSGADVEARRAAVTERGRSQNQP